MRKLRSQESVKPSRSWMWVGFSVLNSLAGMAVIGTLLLASCRDDGPNVFDPAVIATGRDIFRFDTFGDEKFWTDTLRMHEVIQKAVTPAVVNISTTRQGREGGGQHGTPFDDPFFRRFFGDEFFHPNFFVLIIPFATQKLSAEVASEGPGGKRLG